MGWAEHLRQVWARWRRQVGLGDSRARWQLFVRLAEDGSLTGTLVNFESGVHRRLENGHVDAETLAFLRRNAVDVASVRLVSPVRCALPRHPAGWV